MISQRRSSSIICNKVVFARMWEMIEMYGVDYRPPSLYKGKAFGISCGSN